jgi:hypothetical protein
MDNGEVIRNKKKMNAMKSGRGRSPPIKGNNKNKSDQATNVNPNVAMINTGTQRNIHEKEGTRGVFYRGKNPPATGEPHRDNMKNMMNLHKFRKQQTAKQQTVSGGSGGISHVGFSATNPSGASVGARLGKWSGEIIAHNSNISGLSAEEAKKMRKDTLQTSSQTAFQLKGRAPARPAFESTTNDHNFNTSFTESDLDTFQNVEECDREITEHHLPHVTNASHLEVSGTHSISMYKAGLSNSKGQQKRLTVDPIHGPEDEVRPYNKIF